ncbi:uncharacterized protein (DUF736 family) [Mesorhizobium shonense]|uniref:Uncharacterized protein (DUF736 family) n=1 Tax=Mesorhizobium shonense TaxID=1209948 RepID=A0ABV2I6K7_9HYPH
MDHQRRSRPVKDYRHRGKSRQFRDVSRNWRQQRQLVYSLGTGDKVGDYLSLLLDDPTLAQPIRANLFRSDDDDSA